ncbi:parathymosin isoform X1 [Narcine bancroftii]|uniref:parathymosin isoform X1 n=1 Tax=Narcine bancroftii TaxID=1343680 RepID=UPI003831BBF7
MADTVVDTTKDVKTKDPKEKVVEEAEKKENGSGDTPENGTEEENGADHVAKNAEEVEEDEDAEGEGEGEGEEDGDEEEGAEGEGDDADGHAAKRPANEQGEVESKRQKSENGESAEA